MTKHILLLSILFLSAGLSSQSNPQAYALYRSDGKIVSFKKMMKELHAADVILFGEYHNNPISHWIQLEIANALGDYDLGMEMFETDEQAALEQYLSDSITVKQLDSLTGGLWQNFKTDYQPIVDLTRQDSGSVVGTNIPRKYASMVFRGGFEALEDLPKAEKELLPPLPPPYNPELPGYKAMLQMMPDSHGGENFPKAQAIKDATMAWQIVKAARPGRPLLHLNGSYHSDNYEGISWYLRQYKPQLKVVTLTTLEQQDVSDLITDSEGTADFILLVPANMTKTY